jgi:hypothetical protein
MYKFLNDPQFVQHRLDGDCHLFRDIQHPLPTWDDVIQNLNTSIKNKWLVKYLHHYGFVTHNAEIIPSVGELLKYISTIDPNVPSSAHCYFSLTDFSHTFGRHNDPSDVFFWQFIGKTEWTVESKNGTIIHILEPNDLLFVPRGMWHNTKPLTARAGISFGLDY